MPSTLVIMSRSTRHLTAATRRIIERICAQHGVTVSQHVLAREGLA